jgi:hypothetical protein
MMSLIQTYTGDRVAKTEDWDTHNLRKTETPTMLCVTRSTAPRFGRTRFSALLRIVIATALQKPVERAAR